MPLLSLVKHTLRYLHKTKIHGILFSASYNTSLENFLGAEFASAPDRRSISGAVQVSFGAPVSWLSIRQSTVVLSTCKAKSLAAWYALQETLRLQKLTHGMNPYLTPQPTTFHIDNQSAIQIASYMETTKHCKYIDLLHQHISDAICHNRVKAKHVSSQRNNALAKPLSAHETARLFNAFVIKSCKILHVA